jgi:hypothetical protein
VDEVKAITLKTVGRKIKLAEWVCVALAFGVVLCLLVRERKGRGPITAGLTLVTKPYSRDGYRPEERMGRTKNPREEFEAARKRGLTEDEVRGILEDFIKSGIRKIDLSSTSEEELLAMRIKEHAWYFEMLVDGLKLTKEQQERAESTLRDTGEKNYATFLSSIAEAADSIEIELPPDDSDAVFDGFTGTPAMGNSGVRVWIFASDLLPWNLCELDEGQKEIIGLKYENEQWIWPRPGSETIDYGTEEQYVNLDDSFEEGSGISSHAGKVFPLSMAQVDGIRGAKTQYNLRHSGGDRNAPLLDQLKFLAAPQLKTLLLLNPEIARRLTEELNE